jgi:GTP-binding protein Era
MFRPGVQFLSDEEVKALLPEGPPLYDEESISDRSERFFASELIRESLFETLKKELPYSCEVQVTNFKEPKGTSDNGITLIEAKIFVERDSQKIIIVGKGGAKIKEIGTSARKKIERFLGDDRPVNLKLQVSVKKDWRKKDDHLKEFGYQT